jgi:hypothetical protein
MRQFKYKIHAGVHSWAIEPNLKRPTARSTRTLGQSCRGYGRALCHLAQRRVIESAYRCLVMDRRVTIFGRSARAYTRVCADTMFCFGR